MKLRAALTALALAACETPPSPKSAGTGDPGATGLAVVCTDYTSTSVALVSGDARRTLAPLLVHSGSVSPRIQTALGGDVDVPTSPPPPGTVLLIDRFPNAVLTFVEQATGRVTRQLNVGSAFGANPRDALVLADGRVLVTRYDANPRPVDPRGFDGGDDLMVVGEDGAFTQRFALTGPDGTPARPDRLLRVGDLAWVSLNRVSADFETYYEGRLARVALGGEGLERLPDVPLAGTANCGPLAPAGDGLAVACGGAFDRDGWKYEAATAALVVLDAAGGEVARLSGADPRVGRGFGRAVAVDGAGRVYGTVYGDLGGQADRVVRWDPAADAIETVFVASAAFVLDGLVAADDGVVVAAEADPQAPRLCRLEAEGPRCLDACAATGLPPRTLGRF